MSEKWNNEIEPIFSTGNIEDQFEDAGKRGNYIHLRYKKRTGKKGLCRQNFRRMSHLITFSRF